MPAQPKMLATWHGARPASMLRFRAGEGLLDFPGGYELQRSLDVGAEGESRIDFNIRWTPLLFRLNGSGAGENR